MRKGVPALLSNRIRVTFLRGIVYANNYLMVSIDAVFLEELRNVKRKRIVPATVCANLFSIHKDCGPPVAGLNVEQRPPMAVAKALVLK
jgi:hypothetical protein